MAIRKAIVLISGVYTQMLSGDTLNVGSGVTSDGTNPLTLDSGGTVIQVAANKNFSSMTGTGAFDWSSSSGVFKTSTGAVTVGPGAIDMSGAVTLSAADTALTVTNDARVNGKLSANGGIGRATSGGLSVGTDANTTAVTIGTSGVTTTIVGPLSLGFGLAANLVVSGITTTGIGSGDFTYLSSANVVSKTDSSALPSARIFGVGEGVSGSITTTGTITGAKCTTDGGAPSVGAPLWLAAASDDGGTGAGKLTATPPSTGIMSEVGICIDASGYAGSKVCKMIIQPKLVVIL